MTKFSSIKPQKAKETPADAEETTATAPGAEATGGDSAQKGYNAEQVVDFFATPRETKEPVIPEAEPGASAGADAGATTEGTETAEDAGFMGRSWNWFKGVFDKDESPVADEMKVEMDEEMYALTASLGTGFSDVVFPALIARMHGDRSEEEFKLKDEPEEGKKHSQRERLNYAWELFFRSKRLRVTPTTYLIGVLAQIYGLPLVAGAVKYWGRISLFGWHWPWSEKWKIKAVKMHQEAKAAQEDAAGPAPVAPASVPQPATPEPTAPEPPKTELQICKYWQWQTDNGRPTTVEKVFTKGNGFPKTSKHKELVQQFGSQTAYIGYLNSTKTLGKKK